MNTNCYSGYLGRDPELSYTATGTAVCKFAIAVPHPFKRDDAPAWIRVVCFGKTAEFVGKYFQKGSFIEVSGYVSANNWEDKEGRKRNDLETIADRVSFGASQGKSDSETPYPTTHEKRSQTAPNRATGHENLSQSQTRENDTDDLPF